MNIYTYVVYICRWMSLKEIDPKTIQCARDDAIHTVCLLEEHFPTSILNIQLHLLVHLVDEVQIAGTVHARWMFFLERFMKTLKGFVRQRARPEGSMAEGWLVQESCVYISEYLAGKKQNIMPHLWSTKDDDRLTGKVPQGKGVLKLFDEEKRTKVHNYCMMNSDLMQKWYERYEARREQEGNKLPKVMSSSWLRSEMKRAKETGEAITRDEEEFAFGPDWHVSYIQRFGTYQHTKPLIFVTIQTIITFFSWFLNLYMYVYSVGNTMHYGRTEVILGWSTLTRNVQHMIAE